MEMELGPFTFPELSQTPTYSKTFSAEILSSLLDIDDSCIPTFPEQLQDVHFLDHFQQFALPEFEPDDPFFLDIIPQREEYSLLDFDPATAFLAQTPSPTTYLADLLEEDESTDGFLNDDLGVITPDHDNYESFFRHFLELASTPTPTADSSGLNPQESPATNHEAAEDEEEEEEEEEETDYPKPSSSLNCKNLFSERNRRKRLSKQLLALRALVPNITKMDKRSVLVDALAYLKGIHEETARIQKERSLSLSTKDNHKEPLPNNTIDTPVLLPKNYPKPKPQILEIDAEKIEDRRFVVKITSKGGAGVGGELLRVIESLGFEITYTALDQIKPMHILTTVFIRVRKQGRMTEEKLRDYITSSALRSGLLLQNP